MVLEVGHKNRGINELTEESSASLPTLHPKTLAEPPTHTSTTEKHRRSEEAEQAYPLLKRLCMAYDAAQGGTTTLSHHYHSAATSTTTKAGPSRSSSALRATNSTNKINQSRASDDVVSRAIGCEKVPTFEQCYKIYDWGGGDHDALLIPGGGISFRSQQAESTRNQKQDFYDSLTRELSNANENVQLEPESPQRKHVTWKLSASSNSRRWTRNMIPKARTSSNAASGTVVSQDEEESGESEPGTESQHEEEENSSWADELMQELGTGEEDFPTFGSMFDEQEEDSLLEHLEAARSARKIQEECNEHSISFNNMLEIRAKRLLKEFQNEESMENSPPPVSSGCVQSNPIPAPQHTPHYITGCKSTANGEQLWTVESLKASDAPAVILTLTSFPYRIIHANHAFLQLTRLSDVTGHGFFEVVTPEKNSPMAPNVANCPTLLGRFDNVAVRVGDIISSQSPLCKLQVRPIFKKQPNEGCSSFRYYAVCVYPVSGRKGSGASQQ